MNSLSIPQSPGMDRVRQFTIYAENKVGRLHELIASLRSHGVHVMALTTLGTTDVTILRLVPDYPDLAREAFEKEGFSFVERPIVAVELKNEEDLPLVTLALIEAEINIHYLYSFFSSSQWKERLGHESGRHGRDGRISPAPTDPHPLPGGHCSLNAFSASV